MTESQKSQYIASQISLIDQYLIIDVHLYSGWDGGYRYTQLDRFNTLVDRIVLETGDGRLIEPAGYSSGESDISQAGSWLTSNVVYFDWAAAAGPPIKENTSSITLWLATSFSRGGFRFEFCEPE